MEETKLCCTCKKELPVEMFCRNRSTADGLHRNCRKCKSEQSRKERGLHKERIAATTKAYQENNKDKLKLKSHEYYKRNEDRIKAKTVKYQKSNPERTKRYSVISRKKLRLDVLSHYCEGEIKCKICGDNEIDLLTVDHIHGGGSKHKREIRSLYPWLKRNNYPAGFQILCWNCNYKKRMQEMKPNNPTKKQIEDAEYVRKIKIEVLEHYGRICPCGVADQDILTLDHVDNDGAEHHRQINHSGFNFYLWLRRNNFPNDPPLQVMCMKCNYKKRLT